MVVAHNVDRAPTAMPTKNTVPLPVICRCYDDPSEIETANFEIRQLSRRPCNSSKQPLTCLNMGSSSSKPDATAPSYVWKG